MKISLFYKIISVTLVGVLLGGCAATRIDVDVYKGPLTNHEHVQMEQMAAMAIGAKPLLIALRNQLEPDASIRKLKLRGVYKDDYIHDEEFLITNGNARRVNEILSLYKDRDGFPVVNAVIDEGTVYFEKARNAVDMLQKETEAVIEEDKLLWARIKPCLRSENELKAQWPQADEGWAKELSNGYRALMNPSLDEGQKSD